MKVPGDELQRSEYVDAKKLYEDRQGILRSSSSSGSSGLLGGSGSGTSGGSGVWGSSSSATTYVMPPGGKGWTVQGKLGLPTPPYDRLEFLQAVGVPIGKDSLLVDAAVLKDALEITVQIDEHTLAAAKVKKVGGDRGGPPLAVLTVSGYEFTPVEGSKSTTLKTPAAAEIYAANAFEEMGQTIREVKLKVRSLGEAQSGKFEQHLLAGECAAPVVTDDGILIGFLAGKTDVGADDGGPNNFYPLRDLLSLISQSSSGTAGASSGTGHSSSGLLGGGNNGHSGNSGTSGSSSGKTSTGHSGSGLLGGSSTGTGGSSDGSGGGGLLAGGSSGGSGNSSGGLLGGTTTPRSGSSSANQASGKAFLVHVVVGEKF